MRLLHSILVAVVFLFSASQVEATCSINAGQATIGQCQTTHQFEMSKILKIFGGLRTSVEVDAYCSNYNAIITCLDPITSGCQNGESALDLTGYDKDSAAKAFKGYCNDKSTYKSGIPCYNANDGELTVCEIAYTGVLSTAQASVRITSDFDAFYKLLCPAQVQGVKCVLGALSTCTSAVREVIKNTGYAMLHGKCKNAQYTTEKSAYDTSGQQALLFSMVLLSVTLMTIIIGG